MTTRKVAGLVFINLLATTGWVAGQNSLAKVPGPHEVRAPVVKANEVRVPIRVNGLLTEPEWTAVKPATEFTKVGTGQAGSERTELRVLRRKDVLYIGVKAFDHAVDKLAKGEIEQSDRIEISLDPTHGHTEALTFTVTAGGETKAERVKNGSTEAVKVEWEARATTNTLGWTAEVAIPVAALGEGVTADGTWGIQVRRVIPRYDEVDSFSAADGVENYGHLQVK